MRGSTVVRCLPCRSARLLSPRTPSEDAKTQGDLGVFTWRTWRFWKRHQIVTSPRVGVATPRRARMLGPPERGANDERQVRPMDPPHGERAWDDRALRGRHGTAGGRSPGHLLR